MEIYILIAANSIEQLRKQDVYRVIDTYFHNHWIMELCDYIIDNRPDLVCEVGNAYAEIELERNEANGIYNTNLGGE